MKAEDNFQSKLKVFLEAPAVPLFIEPNTNLHEPDVPSC